MGLKLSTTRNTSGMQPPAPKGPFFIFLLMMPAFIFLISLLLVAMQYKQLRAFVSDKPMALATVPHSREAEEKIVSRIHGFFDAAPGDTSFPKDTLSISSEELNHLSRSSQALTDMNLDYHLDLQDTLLVARNSLPVSTLHGTLALMAKVMRIRGFLNSEMQAYPAIREGKVTLVAVGAVMNGIAAPATVLEQKGPMDVRDWVADKEFYDKAFARLGAVQVRGGRLLLIRKRSP